MISDFKYIRLKGRAWLRFFFKTLLAKNASALSLLVSLLGLIPKNTMISGVLWQRRGLWRLIFKKVAVLASRPGSDLFPGKTLWPLHPPHQGRPRCGTRNRNSAEMFQHSTPQNFPISLLFSPQKATRVSFRLSLWSFWPKLTYNRILKPLWLGLLPRIAL